MSTLWSSWHTLDELKHNLHKSYMFNHPQQESAARIWWFITLHSPFWICWWKNLRGILNDVVRIVIYMCVLIWSHTFDIISLPSFNPWGSSKVFLEEFLTLKDNIILNWNKFVCLPTEKDTTDQWWLFSTNLGNSQWFQCLSVWVWWFQGSNPRYNFKYMRSLHTLNISYVSQHPLSLYLDRKSYSCRNANFWCIKFLVTVIIIGIWIKISDMAHKLRWMKE